MQRSITHKKSIAPFVYIVLFAIYESLSSIYLFLPPLFGVLFVLFVTIFCYVKIHFWMFVYNFFAFKVLV